MPPRSLRVWSGGRPSVNVCQQEQGTEQADGRDQARQTEGTKRGKVHEQCTLAMVI